LELDSEIMYKLKWLGIFDNEVIGLTDGTPAQILEHILKKKWTIQKGEKDMIVMWHKFRYLHDNKEKEIQSHMVLEGKDAVNTAMSMTVGLPLAVTAKLILRGQLNLRGIKIPTEKSIYEPVMRELETHGIRFVEDEKEVSS
jgi:saccharopine dehydrogenase-like NADP-dependent oxidoreductase